MRFVATVEQTRAADRAAAEQVGEWTLICRAAAAVANTAVQLLRAGRGQVYGARVVVLAGSGHNAADALLAGQALRRRGAQVRVLRSSDRAGDELWCRAAAGLPQADPARPRAVLDAADLVIDGMVGIGAAGALRGRAADLAGALAGAPVLAVDIPSGVDADTGAVTGPAVRAGVTVTFDRAKPGHLVGAGAGHAGQLVVAPVGLAFPAELPLGVCDADDVAALLPAPAADADKYSRGVVGVAAGSDRYPGAGVLCAGGAVRAGAGYVRYLGGAPEAVRAAWPTVVAGEGRVDAYVCGSGMAGGPQGPEQQRELVRRVLDSDLPAVLDAGALDVGAGALRGRRAPTLITPHAGEFARLTGRDPAGDPLGAALAAARDLGVHVLLKGQRTVVAAPDGRARVNLTATTWLSTAGTGDVLAGAAGALLAAAAKRGDPDVLQVAASAAFLHGLAGRYAPVPLNAADLLDRWPDAVAAVLPG